MTKQIVGYIRVSTAQQGKSGRSGRTAGSPRQVRRRRGANPIARAKLLQKGVISDALRDRHRGCRAAESPGCCPLRGSARAFPGRRPRAGIARRRSAPACHRGARATDRWSLMALDTLAGVRGEMARLYRLALNGRIRSDEMTRLVYVLKEIRACLEAEILTDVQQRLALLSRDMENQNGHRILHQPTFPRS